MMRQQYQSDRRSGRKLEGRLIGSLLALWACAACGGDDEPPVLASYASWVASPQDYGELSTMAGAVAPEPVTFDNQTIRQVVHLSAGGDELRVRLSNLLGAEPLTVDAAGVALCMGGPAIDMSSQTALTFNGDRRVTVPAGQEIWSDFVPLGTANETDLAVTLYLKGPANAVTVHRLGQQTAYVAPGDAVRAETMVAEIPAPATPRTSYYWLTGVESRGAQARRVVVAFGDSITDGLGSTIDANRRYPNFLSQKLNAQSGLGPYSTVNAGISGNRVLRDGRGPSGLSRFGRDALGAAGVSHVIILLGINDIGVSGRLPEQDASAEAITGGLATLVAEAKSEDVRVLLGTLLPFKGTNPPYYGELAETRRQAVNAWIRTTADVDGIVDFDRAMQDATDLQIMDPLYDSGDHLHPNDAGYAAMADAIDLALLD
jgi:lysophospholipase L1-like esterase